MEIKRSSIQPDRETRPHLFLFDRLSDDPYRRVPLPFNGILCRSAPHPPTTPNQSIKSTRIGNSNHILLSTILQYFLESWQPISIDTHSATRQIIPTNDSLFARPRPLPLMTRIHSANAAGIDRALNLVLPPIAADNLPCSTRPLQARSRQSAPAIYSFLSSQSPIPLHSSISSSLPT